MSGAGGVGDGMRGEGMIVTHTATRHVYWRPSKVLKYIG